MQDRMYKIEKVKSKNIYEWEQKTRYIYVKRYL